MTVEAKSKEEESKKERDRGRERDYGLPIKRERGRERDYGLPISLALFSVGPCWAILEQGEGDGVEVRWRGAGQGGAAGTK